MKGTLFFLISKSKLLVVTTPVSAFIESIMHKYLQYYYNQKYARGHVVADDVATATAPGTFVIMSHLPIADEGQERHTVH